MKHRLDEITDAIEEDFDVRRRVNVPSQARMTFEWAKVMEKILNMPVAEWDCPATASGEISAAR